MKQLQALPKELAPKQLFWKKIEKLGFASHGSHGSHGRRVTNWCNPFTGPPSILL